jgi:hypothetical protein
MLLLPTTGGTYMSLGAHLQELKKKHETLEQRVEQAQRSPGVDDLHVRELKKQKLRLKEEIGRLTT